MSIRVECLSGRDDPEVVAFLDEIGGKSASVLGYHYPFYRDMLSHIGVGEPLYLGAYRDGSLVGFLPAFARQSEVGTVYSSLPFFGPNAGVLCAVTDQRSEIHLALLGALLDQARQAKALCCSVYTPLLSHDFELYEAAMPGAIVVEKFTQYLDLETTTISNHLRKNLRRAEQRGDVEISTEVTPERVGTFYAIYAQNCREFNIPLKPQSCVDFLISEGLPAKRAALYFAFCEGQMIGGLLVILSRLTVSYYIPCSLSSAKHLLPGDLLINRAIKDARRRGNRIWNWESSPSRESGVYLFKRKWGAVEAPYRIYVTMLQPRGSFEQLGTESILKQFPFYFVFPFDRLRTENHAPAQSNAKGDDLLSLR